RGGPIENGAGAQHGAPLDHRAFVDTAVAADQHVVFDNHGHGAHRFQHAANLAGRRDVAVLADLSAATNQRVRIHHGAIVHVGAGVDVHGRHASHAPADVAAVADTGAARHDAHTALRSKVLDG